MSEDWWDKPGMGMLNLRFHDGRYVGIPFSLKGSPLEPFTDDPEYWWDALRECVADGLRLAKEKQEAEGAV